MLLIDIAKEDTEGIDLFTTICFHCVMELVWMVIEEGGILDYGVVGEIHLH